MLKESPSNPRRKEGNTDLQEEFLNAKDQITLCIALYRNSFFFFFLRGLILSGVHHEEKKNACFFQYLIYCLPLFLSEYKHHENRHFLIFAFPL